MTAAARPLRLRLLALSGTLLVQSTPTGGLLWAVERANSVFQAKRYHIRARLGLWVAGALLPLMGCFLLGASETEGMSTDRDSMLRIALTMSLFVYHVFLLSIVAHKALHIHRDLQRHLLVFRAVKACKFAEVPEAARTHDTKCAICLADYKCSDLVLPLPCRHVFHLECLREWLQTGTTCPMRCDVAVQRPASEPVAVLPGASRGPPAQGSEALPA